ncbi:hypothetical protein [Micromonospora chersina]|uniref:Uncharacterized protein n=1 Tax=Micromonospora chersina TaxID=47854 RepID=A0A1C6VA37_9ACTN|nr:hypothetical protein [Micromonospora chersina]SCL63037.1 hypothetical protein GA0070603_3519 [Micromonospora chersina]
MGEEALEPESNRADSTDKAPVPNISRSLWSTLRRFLLSISGVEGIVHSTGPHLPAQSKVKHLVEATTRSRGSLISPEQRRALESIMSGHIEAIIDLRDEKKKYDDPEVASAFFEERFKELWAATYEKYQEVGVSAPTSLDLLQATTPRELERPTSSVLYSSLLISTVGMCEVFLGQAMREYLTFRPQALHGTEIRFQFAEMQQFSSIESLKAYHIDRQVDSIIRQGGIDEWMKWFEVKVKLSFAEVSADPMAVREIFQRRHVHVHNDGEVSAIYLAKMADTKRQLPELDTYLRVDESYLLQAVDRLRTFGIALAVVLARKLTPKGSKDPGLKWLESHANDLVYGLLCANKYESAVEIVNLLIEDTSEQSVKTMMLVNRWIAQSRLGKEKAVRKEVRDWDTSALDAKFHLAQLTLLGETEQAHALAMAEIGRGALTEQNYREWPLFAPLREIYPPTVEQIASVELVPVQREESTADLLKDPPAADEGTTECHLDD